MDQTSDLRIAGSSPITIKNPFSFLLKHFKKRHTYYKFIEMKISVGLSNVSIQYTRVTSLEQLSVAEFSGE